MAIYSHLLGLELVGSYDVCDRHNLFFVNRKEILWNVLKEKERGTG